MKHFLWFLFLASGLAFANPYTVTPIPTPVPLDNINNGGVPLRLGDDSMSNWKPLGFDFTFYGNTFNQVNISNNGLITFSHFNNGCCEGQPIPSQGFDNTIFGLRSDLLGSYNSNNPYFATLGDEGSRRFVVGWYDINEYGTGNLNTFEISLFEGSNDILLNYGDLNMNRVFSAGIQHTGQDGIQLYYGSDESQLEFQSFCFSYNSTLCQVYIPPPEPEPPLVTDCAIAPSDPKCVIDSIIDNIDDAVYVADQEQLPVDEPEEEEPAPTEEIATEELVAEEQPLEEVLQEEAIGELVDEETAETLVDTIDTKLLDIVLSVVESTSTTEATQTTTAVASTQSSSEQQTDAAQQESSTEQTGDNSTEVVEEMLAGGLAAGRELLQETLSASSESAEVAAAEAENIASVSVERTTTESVSVASATESTREETSTQETIVVENVIEQQLVEQEQQLVEQADAQSVATVTETQQQLVETSIGETQELRLPVAEVVENTEQQMTEGSVAVADIQQQDTTSEVQQEVVAETTQQETKESISDGSETVEFVAFTIDQSSSQINQIQLVMNLEAAGLNKEPEKSDAEIRSEQVVAANKEEQDAINANYMDADQSGIVAAIGSETDVTSYRTMMVVDNSNWYKPDDIYKGVIIKDNVRNAYFLEKGNSDTYKKLIEEQYK